MRETLSDILLLVKTNLGAHRLMGPFSETFSILECYVEYLRSQFLEVEIMFL